MIVEYFAVKSIVKRLDWQKIFIGGFRSIIFFLDSVVYNFIIYIYNVFRWICGSRVVDNAVMNELSVRVGFILGLIMFFYVSFDFIQIIIDPEKITDKEKGPVNIIKKFLIVIVLLGTSRFIFDLMFKFQTIVLDNSDGKGSIIERVILPYDIDTDNFGRAISAQFMSQFYQITDDPEAATAPAEDDYTYEECYVAAASLPVLIANYGNVEKLKLKLGYPVDGQAFNIGYECINERYVVDGAKKWYIDFDILSIGVGIFVAWILITYCLSVGIRVVQLSLLQIISPAAIICYLSPNKENVFTRWLKVYFSTYVDVFIRIAIIDFVVLLSGLILDSGMSDSFWTSVPGTLPVGKTRFMITVFMIMALLAFAKKFPDLLKQLLPSTMASGLSFFQTPKQFVDSVPGLRNAYGAAYGAVGAAQMNIRRGLGKALPALGGALVNYGKGAMALMKNGGDKTQAIAYFSQGLAKHAEAFKWTNRALIGGASGALGGARRGVMATNSSARKAAAQNAYNRTQSRFKTRDAGYKLGVLPGISNMKDFQDAVSKRNYADALKQVDWGKGVRGSRAVLGDIKRRALMQDQYIEEMAEGTAQSISALQNQLYEAERNYTGEEIVQASKTRDGKYLVYDKSGNRVPNGAGDLYWSENDLAAKYDKVLVDEDGQPILDEHGNKQIVNYEKKIADLNVAIGKAKGINSALNQKANEQKKDK